MENNHHILFFKGLAAFASGVVAAKAATYIPKKGEPKETVFVPSVLTISQDGKEYHPLVVEKTSLDKVQFVPTNVSHSFGLQRVETKQTIRKANI